MHSASPLRENYDMNIRKALPWSRMALEGAVIVFSILLAFAIDAWWDERKEKIEGLEQLARVASELRLNTEMVQSKIEHLQIAIDASTEYLSWMGPEPREHGADAFSNQWDTLASIGTFSVVRRAADDYLGAGQELTFENVDIRSSLSEWYFFADRLENQYEILRTEHWTLIDYANRIPAAPGLNTALANPEMKKHPKSKFPFDQSALLTDPVLEALLANYLIRLKFVASQAQEQQERQARLLAAIDAVIAEQKQ